MSDYVFLVRCDRTVFAYDIRALELATYQRPVVSTSSILSTLADIQIPLPPLEVQQEIVAEIEGYQKVIDGARTVIDNYRPHIPIDPDWPMVAYEESLCYGSKRGLTQTNPN